ncbi:hypothetical protein [Rhizobium sp. FY34]|uniref:hypothetical protein n=1 Tax=Rhizobium sp. FY34 TaxID=2562309 RepID=UPI0010C057C7|nr:hypothetical protein [Rhizobium sp. FY34]
MEPSVSEPNRYRDVAGFRLEIEAGQHVVYSADIGKGELVPAVIGHAGAGRFEQDLVQLDRF